MQENPLDPFAPFEFTAKTVIHLNDHRHRSSQCCLSCITRVSGSRSDIFLWYYSNRQNSKIPISCHELNLLWVITFFILHYVTTLLPLFCKKLMTLDSVPFLNADLTIFFQFSQHSSSCIISITQAGYYVPSFLHELSTAFYISQCPACHEVPCAGIQ